MLRMLALLALLALTSASLLPAALGCQRSRAPTGDDSTAPPPAPSPLSKALQVDAEYGTAPLSHDPDDPAIWVHPTDPARSVILGTMKVASPAGAVVAFGMDGQIRQLISGIDRPNNIDVEYGFRLGGRAVDIAVVTDETS